MAEMAEWRFELVPAPAPGTRATGLVDWVDDELNAWEWPYTAVRGRADGPALLVTAGVHPAEYPAIDSALRFAAALEPATLRGQVLCLPVVDVPAFWSRTAFVCPVDGHNPNRVFPGNPHGSFSQRLAHHLTTRAITRADAYVDLHGGDVVEALEPFSLIQETGDAALNAKTRALADAFGLPNLIVQGFSGAAPISGTTNATAAVNGVPAVLAEAGGCGLNQPEAVALLGRGLQNVLCHLGMVDGAPEPSAAPAVYTKFIWPRTTGRGFFRPAVSVGDQVREGEPLGTLYDLFNQPVEVVASPCAGRVLFMTVSPAQEVNGLVAGIAQP